MYNLSHAEAQLLFEQTINSTHREELTPSERIPKYRSVLEELFQLLTRDAPTHLGSLFARQVNYRSHQRTNPCIAPFTIYLPRLTHYRMKVEQQLPTAEKYGLVLTVRSFGNRSSEGVDLKFIV